MAAYATKNGTHIKGTADGYEAKLKQFDEMMGVLPGERTAELFTDVNQAKFLASISESYNFHPSALKTTSAALGKAALDFKLPNIRTNPALFPEVQIVLKRWQTHLKQNPHYAQKASRWSLEAVYGIGTMDSENPQGTLHFCF